MAPRAWRAGAVLVAFGGAGPALADLGTIVVSATRTPESSASLPVSVDRLDQERLQTGQLQVNLSETLVQVPGVNAQLRQNYAQDLQLSVRGFGARSSFGVRGVRLYSDGIPGTMPDGQGQFSQFDLGSAGHVEVLRGPFSALYGNSSGGVVSLYTEDGAPGFGLTGSATAGSLGTQRYALKGSGDTGSVNYVLDGAHFETSGYRRHGAAERDNVNMKLRYTLNDGSTLTLVGNAVETPFVQDPLGLTRAQWQADPVQAGTNAVNYNTRKSLSQQQAGLIYARRLGANADLSATAYVGERHTTQFQAILTSTQARPTSPGGVIDLDRSYFGLDAHATATYDAAGPLKLTAGASYDELGEGRHGYLNYVGHTLGVVGATRRDLQNRVYNLDQYLEAQWEPSPRWLGVAGVRHSLIDVRSNDHLQTAGLDPFSGVRYTATNPVAGITFRATPLLNLYVAYGRGFETPTLNDLAYRSTDGSLPGLNFGLKAAHSDNYEAGLKAGTDRLSGTLAAFYVRTRDELAVIANSGGRPVYGNIDETTRKGVEASLDGRWSAAWSTHVAYTYLKAVTGTPYTTCVTLPCVLSTIPAGSRLPAVPANALYAGLTWQPQTPNLSATLETVSRAQMYVDDRNSDAAPGYWLLNAHLTWRQDTTGWRLSETIRVDNLADRRYVGSVIVNESNLRFFEPEPGRTFLLGIQAQFRP